VTAAEDLSEAVQALVLDHQIVPCGPDPAPWYGDTPAERAEAAKRCRWCTVLALCAAAADENREKWGVWGGVDRQHRPTGKGRP
jgi:WhiB family redox-sensing transcriptional regulator